MLGKIFGWNSSYSALPQRTVDEWLEDDGGDCQKVLQADHASPKTKEQTLKSFVEEIKKLELPEEPRSDRAQLVAAKINTVLQKISDIWEFGDIKGALSQIFVYAANSLYRKDPAKSKFLDSIAFKLTEDYRP